MWVRMRAKPWAILFGPLGARSSGRNLTHLGAGRQCLLIRLEIKLDGLTDIGERFFTCASRRGATGQLRAPDRPIAVWSSYSNTTFHFIKRFLS